MLKFIRNNKRSYHSDTYNKYGITIVKIMVRTTTRIITEDTILRVFLLFILNIFVTLLSYKSTMHYQYY